VIRVFRHYIAPLKILLISMDALLLCSAMLFADAVSANTGSVFGASVFEASLFSGRAGGALEVGTIVLSGVYALLTAVFFLSLGVYETQALNNTATMTLRVGLGLVISGILLAAFGFFYPGLALPRSVLLLSLGLGFVTVAVVNGLMLSVSRVTAWQRRVIIYGCGRIAADLVDSMEAAAANSFHITAICPDGDIDDRLKTMPTLADGQSISAAAMETRADLVIIAPTDATKPLPTEALVACRLMGCEVLERRMFLERVRGIISLHDLDAQWIVYAHGFTGARIFERILKRLVDLTLASGLLIAALPLMVGIAVTVTFTSPGPVIFRQTRIGRYGIPFQLLKFRTMRADGDKTAKWAERDDPRITAIGKILRPTRLDELPQLINVLRGEMSFVGPRPEQESFVQTLRQNLPLYDVRHAVKPGITGWAQIHLDYAASEEDSRRKLERDLYYVKNASVFLDVLIAIQTVRVILFRQGGR